METVEKIFTHFGRSEKRLHGNAEKVGIIIDEINALESLAEQLRELASCFQGGTAAPTEPKAVSEKVENEQNQL